MTLLLGIMLGAVFAAGAFKLVARGATMQAPVLIVGAVIGLLAAFLVSAGGRMTFNRPNRHGSLLTPALWFAIAALFFTCAVFIASTLLATRQFAKLEVAGYAFAFAALAVMAGRRAMKKRGRVS